MSQEQLKDKKKQLTAFVLNEIDDGQMTGSQIAKMLLDVSMNYLRYKTMDDRDCYNEKKAV